jgi:hypothetical protein
MVKRQVKFIKRKTGKEDGVFKISYEVAYNDMDSDKKSVVAENRGKPGVYRLINLTNENIYVGSSSDLGRRFTSYYSFMYIDAQKTSLICKALLKYGYSKFRLEVLEYCPRRSRKNF